VSSKFVKGMYVNGWAQSANRPEFYRRLGLRQGTINIQLPHETAEDIFIPTKIISGVDAFDAEQNFRIRPCKVKGVAGYQILPIDKSTRAPKGHYGQKQIEISLKEEIELEPNEELEVELEGFED
jgi:hypothetical protein